MDNLCLFCSSSLESALHIFIVCPFARVVYDASHMQLGLRLPANASFYDWLSLCVDEVSSRQFAILHMFIHGI